MSFQSRKDSRTIKRLRRLIREKIVPIFSTLQIERRMTRWVIHHPNIPIIKRGELAAQLLISPESSRKLDRKA